jgi:hypothetical protein
MLFNPKSHGLLAFVHQGQYLALRVRRSAAGYYIGAETPEGAPNTRESQDYWPQKRDAVRALATGEWRQKLSL